MSLLNVDKIDPNSGTALEIGTSGDTVTVPTGVGLTLTDSTLLLPTTIQTDKLDPKSGTALEIGTSGDTITVPTGAGLTVTDEVKTNKISPATGVAFALGDSGDTFTVPSGATIDNLGTATGFGDPGLAGMDMWRQTADTSSNAQPITANWEQVDTNNFAGIGTAFSAPSTGVWTFPSTGIWEVEFEVHLTNTGSDAVANSAIQITINDGGAWAIACYSQAGSGTGDFKANFAARTIVDVTDTANVKFKLDIDNLNGSTMQGDTSINESYVIMKKLGAT